MKEGSGELIFLESENLFPVLSAIVVTLPIFAPGIVITVESDSILFLFSIA